MHNHTILLKGHPFGQQQHDKDVSTICILRNIVATAHILTAAVLVPPYQYTVQCHIHTEEGNSGLKLFLSKWRYANKTLAYFNFWGNCSFNVNKTPNTKRKITRCSWLKNVNTVCLIGINLYSVLLFYICSFSFLNGPVKYTYCTWKLNTVYFICI